MMIILTMSLRSMMARKSAPRCLLGSRKKLVLNQATCEAGEDSANNAIHLSRCCKSIFFAARELRPGDGQRWTVHGKIHPRSNAPLE